MSCYSHSRLNTFEQCKYKYKLQYIDHVKVDIPTTVEAFMGNRVHETLEKLYKDLKFHKKNTLKQLIKYYNESWKNEWKDEIKIVKTEYGEKHYKKMGEKYISDYYAQYAPFNNETILGLETEDRMNLPDGNQYHVRIDKLSCNGDEYYVCDYKTNSRMKTQDDVDEDRQLAMYSIWVKDKYKDAKKVILKWHMLAFNKEVTSTRTEQELTKLRDETVALIKEIENCKQYPTTVTALCDYCNFQSICPAFKHENKLKESPIEFKDDDGVKLVDEYTQLDAIRKETEEKIDELKEKLVIFAKQHELSTIIGSNSQASVKEYQKVIYPEDKEQFVKSLKKAGLYDEYSNVNYLKLTPAILKNQIKPEITKQTTIATDYRITLKKTKEN